MINIVDTAVTASNKIKTPFLENPVYLDVECYPNYFLICFICKGMRKYFEIRDNDYFRNDQVKEIKDILSNYTTVGFSSNNYDMPMIRVAIAGADTSTLKKASNKIINKPKEIFVWEILESAGVPCCYVKQHIDIINVIPGIRFSLKTYAARIGFKKLQDLPYNSDESLTTEQMNEVRDYCFNDAQVTEALTNKIYKELEIRYMFSKEHDVDLMSQSDPSIAEKIFNKKYGVPYKREGYTYDKEFIKYKAPEYLRFSCDVLIDLFLKIKNNEYKLKDDGKIINIPYKVKIANTTYTIGIGGSHSKEKNIHFDSKDKILVDIDVVSYYPNIMMNNNYIPINYPSSFIKDYRSFYEERLEAKLVGDKIKNQTCKIILNGTFGKLGSKFSSLYSPDLLLNVTLTGQLSLLMLIEQLEVNGISVVSANTDGIVVNTDVRNEELMKQIVSNWEERCNLKTESTYYQDVYKQSVNKYLAVKSDRTIKTKGPFGQSLTNNGIAKVLRESITKYLLDNAPIAETVYSMKHDIGNFLSFRKSKDGAYYKGQNLGKTVRWYHRINGDVIRDVDGKKVAGSDGATPLMEIPEQLEFNDIDLDFYIAESKKILNKMGLQI